MTNKELRELIDKTGRLSSQRRLLEQEIKENKKKILEAIHERAMSFFKTGKCETCRGTGTKGISACAVCDGSGERTFFEVPPDTDDDFICRVFDISQLVANTAKAKELLAGPTFRAIFRVNTYDRVDIRMTKEATARLSNG